MRQKPLNQIKKLDHLPQLSQVILKIIDLCHSDDVNRDELIRLISSDAGLTARLMRLINSASINLNKEIQSIESAVIYLGIPEIKNLAVSMAVIKVFSSEDALAGFNLNAFWSHSFKCAVLTQKLAARHGNVDPNDAYLAGLMHDIGKLVLMINFPQVYTDVLNKCRDDHHLTALEYEHFNLTHSDVGGWLCRQWHFSPMISDAVLYVEEATNRVVDAAFPLVKLLHASNFFCSDPNAVKKESGEQIRSLIGIDPPSLTTLMAEVENEFRSMAESLGIGASEYSYSLDPTQEWKPHPLSAESKSDTDIIADEFFEDSLNSKVKEHSAIYGTLETLLYAENIPAVLKGVETGLRILFGVSSILHFLWDEERQLLTGCSLSGDKRERVLNSIGISLSNSKSLLVQALTSRKMVNGAPQSVNSDWESNSPSREGGHVLICSLADEQIFRLLDSDEMFALPMALPNQPVGVIVIGVTRENAAQLIRQSGMLAMVAKLAATAINTHHHRATQGALIQKERAGAASDSMRKVIHEINNPLLIITSYLKMLSMKLPDRHPAQNELAVIDEEIGRIGGLVKSLSPFAAPPQREFEWIDLEQLINDLLVMVKKSIFAPNKIKAGMVVEPKLPRVKSDPNALKQIMINLLKNASEAMGSGGEVQVVLRQVSGSVKLMIDEKRKTPGEVEIILRDTGPGIPDEIMSRLFEPYHPSNKENGSGLGLSIVSTIVKRINGKIACQSRKNYGTEFKIQLPIFSTPGS